MPFLVGCWSGGEVLAAGSGWSQSVQVRWICHSLCGPRGSLVASSIAWFIARSGNTRGIARNRIT